MFLQAVATQAEGSEQVLGAVSQLSKSSIELAEAAANLGALKLILGVFITFVVCILCLFLYQTISMSRRVVEIGDTTKRMEKRLELEANRSLGEAQAGILIRRAFNSLSQTIKYTVLRTRLENHLDNRDYVLSKVSRLLNYEYTELDSFLANYQCKTKSLSDAINPADAQILIDFVMEQVYMEQPAWSVSTMDQSATILLNGLKQEALKAVSLS